MKFICILGMVLFGYGILTMPVYGAVLKIESDFSTVHVGDLLTVKVSIDTQKQTLNAIETDLVFPSDLLDFVSSEVGEGVVTVWLRTPQEVTDGRVSFSGITPGGFMQDDAQVVTLTFKVVAEGQGVIETKNTQLLLHDGLGTEALVRPQNVHIAVVEGVSTIQKKLYYDDELPEFFTPTIERDVDVFSGALFLVFSTLDKNSGLSHFEVKEGLFGTYKTAESPYRIIHQNLSRKIFVKAIDTNQNERIAIVYPQRTLAWHQNIFIITSILIVCVLTLVLVGGYYRRKHFTA
jgi:hypothetical protein